MLDEANRKKLDNIVLKMESNNETSDYIQSVVDDFKSKYDTQAEQPKKAPNILQQAARNIIDNPLESLSKAFIPQAIKGQKPPTLGEAVGQAITVGQTAVGLLPIGMTAKVAPSLGMAAIEGGGEFTKSLLKKKTLKQALIDGGEAGAISLGFSVTSPIFGAVSDFAIKSKAGSKYSKEVINDVIANPKNINDSKYSINEVGQKFHDGVNFIRQESGKLVGELKDKLRNTNKFVSADDLTQSLDQLNNYKRDLKLVVPKGNIGVDLSLPEKKAIAKIDTTFKNLIEGKHKPTIENMMQVLENMDDDMYRLYETEKTGQVVASEVDNYYKKARGIIRQKLNTVAKESFDTAGLPDANKKFSELMNTLDNLGSNRISSKKMDINAIDKTLSNALSFNEANKYKALKQLDAMVPDKHKFLDDLVKTKAGKDIGSINFDTLLGNVLRIVPIQATAKKIYIKPVASILRRGSIGLMNSDTTNQNAEVQ